MKKYVAVIGACGHVGLPFSLVLADAGYRVDGYDNNEELVDRINETKIFPYEEEQGQELLTKHIGTNVIFTSNKINVDFYDVICVMIGTPKGPDGVPDVTGINKFLDSIKDKVKENQLLILRSTVTPGFTDQVIKKMKCKVAFCPERVQQGKSITESTTLPQIIGCYDDVNNTALSFFFPFSSQCMIMTPLEAEYVKLITNVYRYVNFALANEVYMLTRDKGIDINKVINMANHDYPRMNMSLPGPVGGICLTKDWEFLLQNSPFGGVISSADRINQGLPSFLLEEALKKNPYMKCLGIVGMTFKADSDDIRESLSFKLKALAEARGIKVIWYDPYMMHYDPEYVHHNADTIIIMTPHKDIQNKKFVDSFTLEIKYLIDPKKHTIIDIWGVMNNR